MQISVNYIYSYPDFHGMEDDPQEVDQDGDSNRKGTQTSSTAVTSDTSQHSAERIHDENQENSEAQSKRQRQIKYRSHQMVKKQQN